MSDPREVMHCPHCKRQHLDRRWWAHRAHKMHTCAFCGGKWDSERPAIGVRAEQLREGIGVMVEKVELSEAEQRFVLESLRAHDNEGYYFLHHYGFKGTSEDLRDLGRRLCRSLGIPLEGRDWLT